MSLFSGFFEDEPIVPMDDNAAVADVSQDKYLGPIVAGACNVYDTMYEAVKYLLEGKAASLRQMDRWLEKWEKQLDGIAKKYEEILKGINDSTASFEAGLDFPAAREAWDTLQDFQILRRYMGEANYWALFDTLGLIATQGQSAAADMKTAMKAAIKEAIYTILAATDGLMSLESHLAIISQSWGMLYQKMLPLPAPDSVVPNVTGRYYYRPAQAGDPYPSLNGFHPVPIPIPDPALVLEGVSMLYDFDDPSTWVDDKGRDKFLNAEAMRAARQYWGSSYTNETILPVTSASPSLPSIYKRRQYVRAGEEERHPLQVGKTFAQLDTSRTQVAASTEGLPEKAEALKALGVPFVEALQRWQEAFESAHDALYALMQGIEAPMIDESGAVVFEMGIPAMQRGITSMLQIVPDAPDARGAAYEAYRAAVFSGEDGDGSYSPIARGLVEATVALIDAYAEAVGFSIYETGTRPMDRRAEAATRLLQALSVAVVGVLDSKKIPALSQIVPVDDAVPALGGLSWTLVSLVHLVAGKDVRQDVEVEGVGGNHAYQYLVPEVSNGLVSIPAPIQGDGWLEEFEKALVLPVVTQVQPQAYYDDGACVMDAAAWIQEQKLMAIGDSPDAYALPAAWARRPVESSPRCLLMMSDDTAETPRTLIGMFLQLLDDAERSSIGVAQELEDIVGDQILEGRESLAACFGVYGELLGMYPWQFRTMPMEAFGAQYKRARAGSSLYYEIEDPTHIVFRHAVYHSATANAPYAVYHEAMATQGVTREGVTRGGDSYQFLVFPTESISIQEIKAGTAGSWRTVDATGPDERQWAYVVTRNSVPRCPKYVDPMQWSIMDVIHEMLLLSHSLAPICGDNGNREAKLRAVLQELGFSSAQFISELPDGSGVSNTSFQFSLFNDYASRIKAAVDRIYGLRDRIYSITASW